MNDASKSRISRRSLLAGLATMPTLFVAAGSRAAQTKPDGAAVQEVQAALKKATGTKLVILGSGGGPSPMVPGRTRHNTSHVMVSNASAYVLDCGLGVTNQFARTGVSFTNVRSIFITHHHPDHNIEYGPLLLIGWVQGLPGSVRAFGPPPLRQMTEDLLRAYKTTIDFWAEDFKMKPLELPVVKEVSAPGDILQDENVKVTAAIVQHPPVRQHWLTASTFEIARSYFPATPRRSRLWGGWPRAPTSWCMKPCICLRWKPTSAIGSPRACLPTSTLTWRT